MILTFAVNQNISVILSSLALLSAVILLVLWLCRLRMLRRALCKKTDSGSGKPPVSVVIYTYANCKGLQETLDKVRAQKYDGPMEIIVVNDGKDHAVDDLLTIAETTEPRLRSTFTPHDTRNISRKKLALTLGIKATRHPVVVLLTSESRPAGEEWLSAMAAPFADEAIDLVLGYAAPSRSDIDGGILGRGLRHDMLLDDIIWLSDAESGNTWRGDGDNMAIRRRMFFDNMGYGNSLNLQYGDDDVFVSDTATAGNSAVVLSPQAHVATEAPGDTPRFYRNKRERHDLMASYCSRRPRWRVAMLDMLPWCWLIASLGACVAAMWGLSDAFSASARIFTLSILGTVLLSAAVLWIWLGVAFNRVSTHLTGCPLRWTVAAALLSHPLRHMRWRPRKAPRSWQQPC